MANKTMLKQKPRGRGTAATAMLLAALHGSPAQAEFLASLCKGKPGPETPVMERHLDRKGQAYVDALDHPHNPLVMKSARQVWREYAAALKEYEADHGRHCYPGQMTTTDFEALELGLLAPNLTASDKQVLYEAFLKKSPMPELDSAFLCGYYPDYICPGF